MTVEGTELFLQRRCGICNQADATGIRVLLLLRSEIRIPGMRVTRLAHDMCVTAPLLKKSMKKKAGYFDSDSVLFFHENEKSIVFRCIDRKKRFYTILKGQTPHHTTRHKD
jgi:hypothetical protein